MRAQGLGEERSGDGDRRGAEGIWGGEGEEILRESGRRVTRGDMSRETGPKGKNHAPQSMAGNQAGVGPGGLRPQHESELVSIIHVRVTDEDRSKMARRALAEGRPLGNWCRRQLLRAFELEVEVGEAGPFRSDR